MAPGAAGRLTVATKKKPAAKKGKRPGAPPVAQDKLTRAGLEAICSKIIDGAGYRAIAAEYGVGLATLVAWMEAVPERSHACARARETAAQAYDEQALDAIRQAGDAFELAKAREEAIHLRWRAKAVNPRRYGDKVAVGGSDELQAIQHQVHTMSTEALLAIAARTQKA